MGLLNTFDMLEELLAQNQFELLPPNEEKKETDAAFVAAVGIAPVHADGAENKKGNLCPFARADGGLLSGDSGRIAAAASARGEHARAAELY